jgi:hypothetical protein
MPVRCCFQRDRRATAGRVTCAIFNGSRAKAITRTRRGVKASSKSAWRRITTGSNHISAYGVWRDHARRAMTRINRTGETRWHRVPAASIAVDLLREKRWEMEAMKVLLIEDEVLSIVGKRL